MFFFWRLCAANWNFDCSKRSDFERSIPAWPFQPAFNSLSVGVCFLLMTAGVTFSSFHMRGGNSGLWINGNGQPSKEAMWTCFWVAGHRVTRFVKNTHRLVRWHFSVVWQLGRAPHKDSVIQPLYTPTSRSNTLLRPWTHTLIVW